MDQIQTTLRKTTNAIISIMFCIAEMQMKYESIDGKLFGQRNVLFLNIVNQRQCNTFIFVQLKICLKAIFFR